MIISFVPLDWTSSTTHYCYVGCQEHTATYYYHEAVHEHDYRQLKDERILFCRKCGETKRVTSPK